MVGIDVAEGTCPVCNQDSYLQPAMRFLVPPCGHAVCTKCVAAEFGKAKGAPVVCLVCAASAPRAAFVEPTFDDPIVQRDVIVRRRVYAQLARPAAAFASLRLRADYLEARERIVAALVLGSRAEADAAEMEMAGLVKANPGDVDAGGLRAAATGRARRQRIVEAARADADAAHKARAGVGIGGLDAGDAAELLDMVDAEFDQQEKQKGKGAPTAFLAAQPAPVAEGAGAGAGADARERERRAELSRKRRRDELSSSMMMDFD